MEYKINRRHAIACSALGTLSWNAFAQAPGFPTRPIKILVPYAAGGGTDTFARLMAEELSRRVGQAVIVDNAPGGAGMVAGSMVKSAAPDGYTLLVDQTSIATNPMLYEKVTFDVKKDLRPVILGATLDNVLLAHPSFPANNIKDAVDLIKNNPGKYNYASTGIGSPQHLAMEVIKDKFKLDIVHIPYKGGNPGIVATAANEVQLFFISIATALPFIRDGRVKAIGSGGEKRSPLLPNTPTLSETFPGVLSTNWLAFFAPSRTDSEVVLKLNAYFREAIRSEALINKLRDQGMELHGGSPEDLSKVIDRDMNYFGTVIKSANIKAS